VGIQKVSSLHSFSRDLGFVLDGNDYIPKKHHTERRDPGGTGQASPCQHPGHPASFWRSEWVVFATLRPALLTPRLPQLIILHKKETRLARQVGPPIKIYYFEIF